ncbi:hypothetical protein [Halobacillus litoralis]|uniref:hypothetical protein n=1 Tax=Halobacillus litoralis TaxID=45668 RepID=UPI00248FADC6|nr:hypothetical protein [Halobacillus litoralis]
MVTPAGTARAEDPLGQVIFLTKLAEAVPAASTHRQAIREKQRPSHFHLITIHRTANFPVLDFNLYFAYFLKIF